jgi:hypothetical protein
MSEYRLSEVAKWLRKDERTIRRWCIAGRVCGAFQTSGGHWRIRATHPRKVKIKKDGFQTRNRGLDKRVADSMARVAAYHARGRGRAYLLTVETVLDRSDSLLNLGDDPSWHERYFSIIDKPPSKEAFNEAVNAAMFILAKKRNESGGRGVAGLARALGIKRGTFLNYYGSLIPHDLDQQAARIAGSGSGD